ncbi:MAG: hypothetical protein ACOYB1_09870 [Limnohabitans sp.]
MTNESIKTKLCKDCKSKIHKDARICPICKKKQKISIFWKIITVLMVFGLIGIAMDTLKSQNGNNQTTKTPAQIEQQKIDTALFQADVQKIRALKASMKNPDSFNLISALRIDKTMVLCVEYRATNSFNAIITERKAISKDFSFTDWTSQCAGKSGIEMKAIRHAL